MTKPQSYIPRIPRSVDLLVIGGGINGCAIARDAAGRGLGVLLVEQGDLASGTSSASSKLIHGGLRYLEHYDFALVRESLREQRTLMKAAPHLVSALKFILPHTDGQRPFWMIRAGLALYDMIGGRRHLPGSRAVSLTAAEFGPLKPQLGKGFAYYDCWSDDARLVIENAVDAARLGAAIATRTECRGLTVGTTGRWRVELRERYTGARIFLNARAVINAGGPWADRILSQTRGVNAPDRLRLVKGSHILVRRFYAGDHAFTLQNSDGRIVFVIPMERDYLLIGTTEETVDGNPGSARISATERRYLTAAVERYFDVKLQREDIVKEFTGVRPLVEDNGKKAGSVSREHRIVCSSRTDEPPMYAVLGGKLTTHRLVAEEATDAVCKALDRRTRAWTARVALPGGRIDPPALNQFIDRCLSDFPSLSPDMTERLARTYGARATALLKRLAETDAPIEVASGVTDAELRFLIETEWARETEDVVWRRGKLDLHLTEADKDKIDDWMTNYREKMLTETVNREEDNQLSN